MEKPMIEISSKEKTPEQYLAEYCHRVSQQSLDFTGIWKNEKINKLLDEIFKIISKNGVINKMEPVKCGCGGEAIIYINGARQAKIYCEKCGIESNVFATKYEAIEAWNKAMGSTEKSSVVERTAKVRDKKDDPMVDEWYHGRCMNCGKQVRRRNNYCSRCGCRLEWDE